MFNLFRGGKSDHPLANEKEAKQLLADLPTHDPYKCLEDLGYWVSSLAGAEGLRLEERLNALQMLDEAAQPHLRKLSKDYLSSARLAKFTENRIFTTQTRFWREVEQSYAATLAAYAQAGKAAVALKGAMAAGVVRALRACASQLKWMALRYGPIEPRLWAGLAGLYRESARLGLAQQALVLHVGIEREHSVEQELLRALIFNTSAPNSLTPAHAEIADRLAHHFSPEFSVAFAREPGHVYWFDLAGKQAPARAVDAGGAHGLYFGPGSAAASLQQLIATVEKGDLPADVNLGGNYPPEEVMVVLKHLAAHWSEKPPERRHPRTKARVRLDLLHGYEAVTAGISSEGESFFFVPQETESWVAENISAAGFGATFVEGSPDWLRIGRIVAARPEGGARWSVGIVRRIDRDSTHAVHVGVEAVSQEARPVEISEAAQFGSVSNAAGEKTPAVLLTLDPAAVAETGVVMKLGSYAPGRRFDMEVGADQFILYPVSLDEQGEDFELARFRLMRQDRGD